MAEFQIVRDSSLTAAQAWDRVTDWSRHADHVPFTTITLVSGPDGRPAGFVARTGIGPFGFDDPMTVLEQCPPSGERPGVVRLEKTGRVVLGRAELTVSPTADGCRLVWREEARLRGTGGPVDRLVNRVAARGFARLLDALLEP